MTAKIQCLLIFSIFIFITGCPNKKNQVVDDLQTEPVAEYHKGVIEKPITITELKKADQKSILINGNKFIVDSLPLVAGSIVFDVGMQEQGTITSQIFVYFASETDIDPLDWPTGTTRRFFAGKTYVVTSMLKDHDMLTLYHELKNKTWASKVEMRIDYSPISQRDVF